MIGVIHAPAMLDDLQLAPDIAFLIRTVSLAEAGIEPAHGHLVIAPGSLLPKFDWRERRLQQGSSELVQPDACQAEHLEPLELRPIGQGAVMEPIGTANAVLVWNEQAQDGIA